MKNFKKIFFVFFLFFTSFSFNANSEVVNEINVIGSDRISTETIAVFGDIQIGENYENSDISLIIKKLYETTFFKNILIEIQNGVMTIRVEENPIVHTIILKGEKAKKYKEVLFDLFKNREKSSFINNYIKSDINIMKEFYRSLGFYFVKIDLEIETLQNNRVNLVYSIDKGEKAKIAKIYFLGDKKIREKRLRDIITSQEAKFWKFISRNVYLNQGRVELDKRLLKTYYKNKGYYEVDITSSNVEYAEGEGFILTYSINAGKRYKFKKVAAEVSEALDQEAFMSLEKEFNKIVGDYYSQRKLTSILEKIDKLSEQKELQFVNHRAVETLDEDGIDVKIQIFEGQKFTIERINIVGNSVTNDSVIRGELVVDEGDPYSALLVNKSINKLKARNIFGNVKETITDGSSPDLKVLKIEVEEKATGELSAGAGVGTDGTAFMFAIKENNWLGRGIELESLLELTEETISGNISVSNPNYNYTGNSIFTALNVSSSDKTANSGFKSNKTGYMLGTEFEQYENVFLSPAFDLSFEEIDVESSASSQLQKMDGNYTNLDFSYGIVWDKRNQVFQPTAGYRTKFSQSLPLIQDSSAIVNGIDLKAYRNFSEDVIGVAKFYARAVNGVDDDVRLTSRIFLPAKKLRGFNTRRVGPKDGEDWVGGNYTSAFGLEAQLPNLLPESTRTDFSVFFDAGNVWEVDYSNAVDDTNKIRSSVGVSANVYTTIGPLTFTFAQDLSKSTNDETESFNFRLGTSF